MRSTRGAHQDPIATAEARARASCRDVCDARDVRSIDGHASRGLHPACALSEFGLAPGALVSRSYRLRRVLGAGGMGVVVLARDELLDRLVAIKFIRPAVAEHEPLRALFRAEARAMARVHHPNVVAVHAFGEHAGTPYFVMDYVDGPSVEEWVAARFHAGMPRVDDALEIFRDACLGVAAIHHARTVHRDLKPSNLLLDREGHVAVSDLGVARCVDDGTLAEEPCTLVGSAAYMAPEAALGEDCAPELATPRDIYALGCVLYELLTGQTPFVAATDMALMAKHMLEVPTPPSSLRRGLPAGVDRAILRALAKEPLARFASALDMLAAVEEAQARGFAT